MDSGYRRYQNSTAFAFPTPYFTDRNAPLSLGNVNRTDPRTCPMSGFNGSMRLRNRVMREDEIPENGGNARRRIAIAVSQDPALFATLRALHLRTPFFTGVTVHGN